MISTQSVLSALRLVPRAVAIVATLLLLIGFGSDEAHAQTSGCPAGAVAVNPGTNLQSLVDSNGNGTTFCLNAGTYTQVSVSPKDGQSFIANGAVTFDGQGAVSTAFNGVRAPSDPSRNAENVTLRGITFTNYRTNAPNTWAVLIPDSGWVIENVVIRDSTSGIRGGNVNWTCANNFVLRDTLIENISHHALFWNGTNGLTERITVRNSGYGANRSDANWLGVVKYQNQGRFNSSFSSTSPCEVEAGKQMIIQDSTFENLNSVGLWCDISCRDFVVRRNTIRDNYWSGIMFEISGGGHSGATSNVFEQNVLSCNRRGDSSGGGWGGAEIFMPNSNGIVIRNNDITVCDNGRAFSFVYEAWRGVPTRDITVENNVIRMQGTPTYSGGNPIKNQITVTCCDSSWMRNANIAFRGNQYYVANTGAQYFEWGAAYAWSAWQSTTGDTSSFANLNGAPPAQQQPTPNVPPTVVGQQPTVAPTSSGPGVPPSAVVPYHGVATTIPGRIEAEDFDLGGLGLGYNDTTSGNEGGASYRTDTTDVDLKANSYGGYTVGWFTDNEWLQYTVNVVQEGYYDITVGSAAVDADRRFSLTLDGQPIVENATVPVTGNWDTLSTVTIPGVFLPAGTKILRLTNLAGFFDLDYIEFAPAAQTEPTQIPPTPEPPVETPVTPTAPGLRSIATSPSYTVGETATVDFVLDLPDQIPGGVKALEAVCALSPVGIVAGQSVAAGTLFAPDPVTINSGFRADSSFTFAISQTNDNPGVTTSGAVFSITVGALADGTAQVDCTVTIVDGNGAETALPYTAGAIVVGADVSVQTLTVEPPQETPQAPPTEVPPTEVTPEATPEATETVEPTEAPTIAPENGGVSGIVLRSHGPSAGIDITLLAEGTVIASTTTGDDGSFTLSDVLPGDYVIHAETPGYLPGEGMVTVVGGQVTEKSTLMLLAGYIVPKETPVIDELDVVQLAVNYGQPASEDTMTGDLDSNGRVGLGDLSALAENLRATGPIAWN